MTTQITAAWKTNASINGYIYHEDRDYTVHAKQRKNPPNELSVFLKTSFILQNCSNNSIEILHGECARSL